MSEEEAGAGAGVEVVDDLEVEELPPKTTPSTSQDVISWTEPEFDELWDDIYTGVRMWKNPVKEEERLEKPSGQLNKKHKLKFFERFSKDKVFGKIINLMKNTTSEMPYLEHQVKDREGKAKSSAEIKTKQDQLEKMMEYFASCGNYYLEYVDDEQLDDEEERLKEALKAVQDKKKRRKSEVEGTPAKKKVKTGKDKKKKK